MKLMKCVKKRTESDKSATVEIKMAIYSELTKLATCNYKLNNTSTWCLPWQLLLLCDDLKLIKNLIKKETNNEFK